MNKNILSAFILVPFIVGAWYLVFGNPFNNTNNSPAEIVEPLDLNLTDSKLQLKTLNTLIETEDNKGLGYTGQNKMAFDSKGNFYFTYRQKVEGKYEIFVAKFDKKLNLVFSKPITTIKNTQRVSSIAIDYQDTIHIVWYGLNTAEEAEALGRQIKYSRSKDGGENWSDQVNIGPVEGYKEEDYWQEHPQISSSQKNLYITWEGKDANNENQQIKFATSTNLGETWSNWKNIYETKNATQSRPSIVIDSEGNLHLFFYSTFGENAQQIRYTSSTNTGKSWSRPVKLSNDENHDARHITASYLKDKIIAVWREGPRDLALDKNPAENLAPTKSEKSESESQIYYSILDLTENGWTDPQVVATSDNFQFFPAITTNGSTAIIVWMENQKQSGFPNEDPEPSSLYLSKIDLNKKEIIESILVDKDAAYPHLTLDVEKNIFYLLYQKELNPSKIVVRVGEFE